MSLDNMTDKNKSSPEYAKKHAKLSLLIVKKFSETGQLYSKECLRLAVKILSSHIEKYNDNFDFAFLVLKQVIINYIDKARSSQDITDYVFPLIHLLSTVNLHRQKDIVVFAEWHKTLMTCVRKLLANAHVVNEHREILFNSVVLPGIEELKAVLLSTRQVDALDKIKFQSVMMIELVESFAIESQIDKFIHIIVEGIRVDNFANNKCYVNEMLIILAMHALKIIETCGYAKSLASLFTDKLGSLLDQSEQCCREFRTLSPDIITKQTSIEQLSYKLSQNSSVIDRIRMVHHYYKIDQLGFEGIFKEKELLLEAMATNVYIRDGFYNNPSFVLVRTVDYLISNHYALLSDGFVDRVKVWTEISLSVVEDTFERLSNNTFDSGVLALYLKSIFLKMNLKFVRYKVVLAHEIEINGRLGKRRQTI